MDSKNNFKVIGLMSGTSLDGLDIAYCHLLQRNNKDWKYSIKRATTLKYPASWSKRLATAQLLDAQALLELDMEFGSFLGKACEKFIQQENHTVDFIASHGHTVFDQPSRGFTYQIGNGNAIHAACGVPVIYDFRSLDVQLGGQGAPLVPVGDKLLFGEYDVCLNLGGIANLSMEIKKRRVAYDVCFLNMGLNLLAMQAGKQYDEKGQMTSRGAINTKMLTKLNKIYSSLRKNRPSLGREIFEQRIEPVLQVKDVSLEDKLRTFTEASAAEIAYAIVTGKKDAKVLCTGGGTFNSFFVSC